MEAEDVLDRWAEAKWTADGSRALLAGPLADALAANPEVPAEVILLAAAYRRGPLARWSFCFLGFPGWFEPEVRTRGGSVLRPGTTEPEPNHLPVARGVLKYGHGFAMSEGSNGIASWWQHGECPWNCYDCASMRQFLRITSDRGALG